MTIQDAIKLIMPAQPDDDAPQQWTDLGCGNGLFSQALASLLPKGSHIIGVDKSRQSFRIKN